MLRLAEQSTLLIPSRERFRPYLLQDIPDYAKLAQPATGGYSKILDFLGPDPPDGYGKCLHRPGSVQSPVADLRTELMLTAG